MASPPGIGTAGWSIPTPAGHHFPGEGSHLERYSAVLSAVEINSSFHRLHRQSTYERWAASVPADFRFSVKIPKTISHSRHLVDVADLLDAFVHEVTGLGDRLAVVLLQLPPSFAFERSVAEAFFADLRGRLDEVVAIACEPRHASWFEAEADGCMRDHRVSRVVADPVLVAGGERYGGWPGLRYHRLHGSPRVYYSAYERQQLAILADTLSAERESGAKSWCVFDNTAAGAAITDALVLKSIVHSR